MYLAGSIAMVREKLATQRYDEPCYTIVMENIGDILAGRQISEPPEVKIIKKFMHDAFNAPATVIVRQQQIIISVQSAALAGALRLRLGELKGLCETSKRLVIRIGV